MVFSDQSHMNVWVNILELIITALSDFDSLKSVSVLQTTGRRYPSKEMASKNELLDVKRMAMVKIRSLINEECNSISFSPTLTSRERAAIHALAHEYNLKSFSQGIGKNRFLSIVKKGTSNDEPIMWIRCETIKLMKNLFESNQAKQPNEMSCDAENPVLPSNVSGKTVPTRFFNIIKPTVPKQMLVSQSRKCLPIWEKRNEIVHTILNSQVVIISGETGSGKTTQVPQFIMENAAERGSPCKIICSMPRRVAVSSISEQVAHERQTRIGDEVGFQMRLNSRISSKTVLTYCTNGILQRAIVSGKNFLTDVTHIIIDEIHERSHLVDFSLITLRKSLETFTNLKLILMSATLDTDLFIEYFKSYQCDTVQVEGRLFDVHEVFLDEAIRWLKGEENIPNCSSNKVETDGVDCNQNAKSPCGNTAVLNSQLGAVQGASSSTLEDLDCMDHIKQTKNIDHDFIVDLLLFLHTNLPISGPSAFMVFLPGYEDIHKVKCMILSNNKRFCEYGWISIFTLHSKMQMKEQRSVFFSPPTNYRKIILTTNIAETSITIPDICVVIDSGRVKVKKYTAGAHVLETKWISKACAKQRSGRAGRVANGLCIRMFSSNMYEFMANFTQPEILRVPLEELCLHTKAVGPPNVLINDFLQDSLQPPFNISIRNAVHHLKEMGALDVDEKLTQLGKLLLQLPLEPQYGKMVVYSVILQCVAPVIIIVAMLAHGKIFMLPTENSEAAKKRATEIWSSLGNNCSDHLLYLNLFLEWEKMWGTAQEKQWCDKHMISSCNMKTVAELRDNLHKELKKGGLIGDSVEGYCRANTYSNNWSMVKVALFVGSYPNLVLANKKKRLFLTKDKVKVMVGASSLLRRNQSTSAIVLNLPSQCVFYNELQRNDIQSYMQCCTTVSPFIVCLFGGKGHLQSSDTVDEFCLVTIDDNLQFLIDQEQLILFKYFQNGINSFVARKLKNLTSDTKEDQEFLAMLVETVTSEEGVLNIQIPHNFAGGGRCQTTYRENWKSPKAQVEPRGDRYSQKIQRYAWESQEDWNPQKVQVFRQSSRGDRNSQNNQRDGLKNQGNQAPQKIHTAEHVGQKSWNPQQIKMDRKERDRRDLNLHSTKHSVLVNSNPVCEEDCSPHMANMSMKDNQSYKNPHKIQKGYIRRRDRWNQMKEPPVEDFTAWFMQ